MLNPKTKHFEFGGVWGAITITLGLGFLIDWLYFGCDAESCTFPWTKQDLLDVWPKFRKGSLISWQAFYAYTYWLLGLLLTDRYISGTKVKGTKLRDGSHLDYEFNGRKVVVLLLATLGFRFWQSDGKMPELVFVYEHYLELANVAILYSLVISTWLYINSFTSLNGKERMLALGGNTGIPIYDWFIGRELNPRIGQLDIKTFLEMRPGLLLYVVINLAMMHHQWLEYGFVTDSMILVNLFQNWYVIEGIWFEQGIVSMIDITYDGLGYMLVFGDIALVPFTYTVQSRYLASHPKTLGWLASAAILLVYFTGLAIFRLSNNEKAKFKSGDPSTQRLEYIETPTGSKLLTSGWWGVARHINYTGDWIMAIAYSLPCGMALIPYYYVFFFAGLLIHREGRDEAKCAAKYGQTWTEYKKRVPYRFIPYIW